MKIFQAWNTERERPIGDPGTAKQALLQAVQAEGTGIFTRDSKGLMWLSVLQYDGETVEFGEFSEFTDDSEAETDVCLQLISNQTDSRISTTNPEIIVKEVAG